jgi:hypothetical protein
VLKIYASKFIQEEELIYTDFQGQKEEIGVMFMMGRCWWHSFSVGGGQEFDGDRGTQMTSARAKFVSANTKTNTKTKTNTNHYKHIF